MTAETPATVAPDPHRLVSLDGAHNFRDLGGYSGLDGRTTRWRTLFRADGLHRLTTADLDVLRPFGLRTVIDLRTQGEIDQRGRFPVEAHPVTYHHVPVLDVLWSRDDGPAPADAVVFLHRAYLDMLSSGAARFAAAITALAKPGALPAVFHCAAGKDRTGMLSALVLATVGVDHEQIVTDYGLTAEAIERTRDWIARNRPASIASWQAIPATFLAAPPQAMAQVLDDVIAAHGSIEAFLVGIGVTPATLAALRAALLEP